MINYKLISGLLFWFVLLLPTLSMADELNEDMIGYECGNLKNRQWERCVDLSMKANFDKLAEIKEAVEKLSKTVALW